MPSTNQPSLVFRSAVPDDHVLLSDLWRRCNLTAAYNDPRTDLDFARGKFNSDVLVGELGGRIVASVMVGHDGHRGWLYYVAVDPDQQGHGYGADIVAAGEEWLRARSVPKVMLLIRDTNTVVQQFYERIGYEAAPRIVMQKWLKEPES